MNVEEYVRGKVMPIFNKSLKETTKNRVLVGSVGFKNNYCFYQPHNCRVYFDYKRSVKPYPLSMVKVTNGTELKFSEDFLGCKVTIKKKTIEIINKIDVDKRYIVNLKTSKADVINILANKIKESRLVLDALIKRFGGSSKFLIMNFTVLDNKIEHEAFIDSINPREKFRNEIVKKEYNMRNVEDSDPVFTVNYLTNQSALMDDFDIVKWCNMNLSCKSDVLKLEVVIKTMSFDYREFVSNFLFYRFGGVLK